MTKYMPRSAWTSTARGGAQLTGTKLRGLAFHWPGTTTNAFGVESEAKVAERLRAWRDYHVRVRGWVDIGYNFAIDQAGRVWDLRGIVRVGAHCASTSNPDANHEYIGVLMVLGDSERPSAAMIEAMWDFRTEVFLRRWPGRNDYRGHRQVPGAQTSCPGPYVLNTLAQGPQAPKPPQEEDEMTPGEKAQLTEAVRASKAAETAAEYATKQLNSIGAAISALSFALKDNNLITSAEQEAINAEISGRGKPGLSR